MQNIQTLGQLKESKYLSRSIKDEIRTNYIAKLRNGDRIFEGVIGYDDTVLPDIERAILSRHNILLLGLRGQAKTRIARYMVSLLDEYIPVIEGSEINDDPLMPLSRYAQDLVTKEGDDTPIRWVHRDERYVEKLATPDVSVADLIGDIDPIKAANQGLSYADERVIHFGLIPRSHRSLFVINELPDLQARIQVSLFNILQEGDLQIRGFKMRLPLDIQFVFTANPEDYTNRGNIITPLKDRIESQILTHYPTEISDSRDITAQEVRLHPDQENKIHICDIHRDLVELLVFEARESIYVDEKSGVSTRMGISAMENLVSAAERRMIINEENSTTTRLVDFLGVISSITGRVELVYEGEQEGAFNVALDIISSAIRALFSSYFPNPDEHPEYFREVKEWFSDGSAVELLRNATNEDYREQLFQIESLHYIKEVRAEDDEKERLAMMELILHGLSEYEVIGKEFLESSVKFEDPFGDMLKDL